jgi:hypothetical protein
VSLALSHHPHVRNPRPGSRPCARLLLRPRDEGAGAYAAAATPPPPALSHRGAAGSHRRALYPRHHVINRGLLPRHQRKYDRRGSFPPDHLIKENMAAAAHFRLIT